MSFFLCCFGIIKLEDIMFEQIKELYKKTNLKHIELSQKINALTTQRKKLITEQKEKFGTIKDVPLRIKIFSPKKKDEFIKRKEEIKRLTQEIEEVLGKRDEEYLNKSSSPFFIGVASTEEILKLKVDKIIKNIKEHQKNGISTQVLLESIIKEKGNITIQPSDKFSTTTTKGKYALVYFTDEIINNNQIEIKEEKEKITGSFGKFEVDKGKSPLHFKANSIEGDYLDKKYAIIIPISQIPRETRIISAKSSDFVLKDNVKLTSNCTLVCRSIDYEKLKTKTISNIICIEDKEIYSYLPTILNILGYAHIPANNDGFLDKSLEEKYKKFIENRFGKVSYENFAFTKEKRIKDLKQSLNILKGIENAILQETCFLNESSKKELSHYYIYALKYLLKQKNEEKNPEIDNIKKELADFLKVQDLTGKEDKYIKIYENQLKYLMDRVTRQRKSEQNRKECVKK